MAERPFAARIASIDTKLAAEHAGFQEELRMIEGENYGSFEANRRIAEDAQALADRVRVLFKCAKCGVPARLRCSQTATSRTGAFAFTHGRHTHGGTTYIPRLTVVPLSDVEVSE